MRAKTPANSGQEPGRVAPAEPLDDAGLLAQIARGDHTAFNAFCDRHKLAAYNLALHLAGNRANADDAVQEAMFRVWRSAGHFRGGNPRSWLLRIVARESLRKLKDPRSRREIGQEILDIHESSGPGVVASAEASEELTALRDAIRALSGQERQLVALHFGGGLSQHEIARELAIPQQTISYRLRSALEQLRAKLSRAGFAGAGVALPSELLGAALTSGHPLPAGFAPPPRAALDRHAVNATFRKLAVAAAGVVLLGSLAAVNRRSETGPPLPRLPDSPAPASAPLLAGAAETRALRTLRWTARDGSLEQLKVLKGGWTEARPEDAAARSMKVGEGGITLLLPHTAAAPPCLVSVRAPRLPITGKMQVGGGVSWILDGETVPARLWHMPLLEMRNEPHDLTWLVAPPYVISFVNGKAQLMLKYGGLDPACRLRLSLRNVFVEYVELRELTGEEAASLRPDPEQLAARMPEGQETYPGPGASPATERVSQR